MVINIYFFYIFFETVRAVCHEKYEITECKEPREKKKCWNMCNILVVSMIVLGSWPPCTVHIHIWHINKHPPYAYLSLLRHNNNNDNHFYFSFRRDILLFFSFWLTNMCIVNLCKLCPRLHCDYTQLFPMWLFFFSLRECWSTAAHLWPIVK